jgi:NhaP-type Na+/H+ or K+/H+ antiporter
MKLRMPFWQRLLITIVVMLAASFVAGLVWQRLLGFALPAYLAGAVGGLAALPLWDFLQRIRPSGEVE